MRELERWLEQHGLGDYAEAFLAQRISRAELVDLTDADLRELGLPMGPRKRFLRAVATAGDGATPSLEREKPAATSAGSTEAERRQLTVMFADLVGSTSLSQRLDVEDLREVNLAFQRAATAAIERFDGKVARYMGDGLLAYFGYPRAHEDDAGRAVLGGLALVEAVQAIEHENAGALQSRVGIATGPVIVGDLIGEGASEEWAVVGETPNIAARTQALATADTVVVAPTTHALTEGLFDYVPLGSHRMKGIDGVVELWRATAEREGASRFQATRGASRAQLVGRDDELSLLRSRWAEARVGQGHAAMLCGEAGVGKSRLAQALREAADLDPGAWLLFQCSPHHHNTPLHPFAALLARRAGLGQASDHAGRRSRLERWLGESPALGDDHVAALGALLGLTQASANGEDAPTPQQRKRQFVDALLALIRARAGTTPLLCLFEDIHWADPSTLEVLDALFAEIEALPVLVLLTFRPDFPAPWPGNPSTTLVTLSRMSAGPSERLVQALARDAPLPAAAIRDVVRRADGIPLFIEELTRLARERIALKTQDAEPDPAGADVPETLRDALTARLDHSPRARETAQVAAVIGRDFDRELLEAIADTDAEAVARDLGELVDAGLVEVRGGPADRRYRFRHALIRDAAYDSILRDRRAALHRRAGEALGESAEPALLAHHFEQASMVDAAVDALGRAGDAAASSFSLREARRHYRKAMALLDDALPTAAERRRDRVAFTLDWARCSYFAATREHVEEAARAAKLAADIADDALLGEALYWLGRMHQAVGEFRSSLEPLDRAVEVADAAGDERLRAMALCNVARSRLHSYGEYATARDLMLETLPVLDRVGEHDEATMSRSMLSWICAHLGEFDAGLAWNDEALAIARRQGSRTREANAYMHRANALEMRGDWPGVIEYADGCIELARAAGNEDLVPMALSRRAHAAFMDGRRREALRTLTEELVGPNRPEKDLGTHLVRIGMCRVELGEWDRALETAALAKRSGQARRMSAQIELVQAAALAGSGLTDWPTVQSHFESALDQSERRATHPVSALIRYFLARALIERSDVDFGQRVLDEAATAFRSMGMRWWLERAEALGRL